MRKEVTLGETHIEAVATVQLSDVALLEVTVQAPVPTATDVGS